MARERLTSSAKIGETNTPPFPGTLGNEGRPATPREKYDTFVEQPGFEVQQQGAPWKDNPRDEIGFGIPKAAAMFAAAHKATRLAIMFLGDKVAPTVIEAQARDFMRLGSSRIDAALKRFADSESIYTSAECKEEDKKDEEDKKEEDKTATVDVTAPVAEAAKVEATPAPAAVATPVVTAIPATAPVAEAVQVEAAPVEAAEQIVAEDVTLQDIGDESALTIDMFSEPEVPADMTPEDEQDVGSLFDIDEIADGTTAAAKKQPKKAGVKSLGGQPSIPQVRVASENDELVGLWKDAPDVSDVFGN